VKTWFVRPLVAAGLLILLATVSTAADAKKGDKKKDKESPAEAAVMAQLRAWFKSHASKDGVIGKLEAARAYGYTRPFDAAPGKDDKDDDSENSRPAPGDKRPPFANRPDFQFIDALDKNKDGQISQAEFEVWARDYAERYADYLEAVENAAEAQQKKMQDALKRAQDRIRRFQQSQRGFEGRMNNRRDNDRRDNDRRNPPKKN